MFINTITQWDFQTNQSRYNEFVFEPVIDSGDQYLFDNTKDFYLHNVGVWGITNIGENNTLEFEVGGDMNESNKSISFYTKRKLNNSSQYIHRLTTANPFELVHVTFRDSFFNTLGLEGGYIKEGTSYIVPICWLQWFSTNYNRNIQMDKARIALETVAILSTLGTSSGTIAALEVSMSSTDIFITLNKDAIKENYGQDGEDFINDWDLLTGLYGGAILVNGGYKLSRSVIKKSYQKVVNSKQFRTTLESFSNVFNKIAVQSGKATAWSKAFLELSHYTLLDLASFSSSNFKASLRNNLYAVVVKAEMEYQIAKFEYSSTGDLIFKELSLADDVGNYERIGQLTDINYHNGTIVTKGNLGIYEDLATNTFWLKVLDDDVDALIANQTFKSIEYNDFIKTVPDFVGENATKNESLAKWAYYYWGTDDWDKLYKLFVDNNLNKWGAINWPPFNGAKSITEVKKGNQLEGLVFDRFQTSESLGGSFASPVRSTSHGVEDLVYTYDSRALSNNIEEGTYYLKFKFKSNLPENLALEYGEAIPWFNLSGNAEQVKSSLYFQDLLADELIEVVEKLKYQNGEWITVLSKSVGADLAGKIDEGLEAILNNKLSDELKAHFINDFNYKNADGNAPFKDFFDAVDAREAESFVIAWSKAYKNTDLSRQLRSNEVVLNFIKSKGNQLPQSEIDAIFDNINYPVKEILEDTQGRLTIVLERGGSSSNKVISVHPIKGGGYITTPYSRAYSPDANPSIAVELSDNRLVPDYSIGEGRQYLCAESELALNQRIQAAIEKQKNIVEIEMTGYRNSNV
ncbi:hypothetical protein [Flammeovirga kamogawensis]|uniref:Uncharacterized protein n=1 Tax=Flammeovirga kamogawensis TaxID=373891 RepID=A0ABX8H359_9BACT|nr:hypothetical protein [Flammeovirga kamogawensis]MBB6460277.1 hypothetical protein [Flammeovirga kamogawensis]QWG10088.1 hypothetical protein KM029_20615 [Flammeovirga kamogawensis]TRX65595.1 hypothetical protein EO216_24045 [Flammeovirga kamogawensis]